MRVTLLYYTGQPDHMLAADLMIFTKQTRVRMSPMGFEAIRAMPPEDKARELEYMANTIRSSWEFCDYTFMLEDVTRAFTHQLVRHRHGSYAQQTQQVLKIDPSRVKEPSFSSDVARSIWFRSVSDLAASYEELLEQGATVEQARGILPQNVLTNIVAKFNLRTLVDLFHQRISPRNLGEFRDVALAMRQAVLEVHPWASVFLDRTADRAMEELDRMVTNNIPNGDVRSIMLKLVDQIRRRS